MSFLICRKAWLLPLGLFILWFAALTVVWAVVDPQTVVPLFDNDGAAPVELMTLPLFALIVPLVWLCPPNSGSIRRRCFWSSVWSVLAVMGIIRETDLHKLLFNRIWPDVAAGFQGTVFKMRFLTSSSVPLTPKLFVLVMFILFFASAIIPLWRYFVPLFKDFFRMKPVAWMTAFFGITTVVVLFVDRLPSNLRKAGHPLSDSMVALTKVYEEGGEMLMALLALMALLTSHLLFVHKPTE